MKKMLRSMVAYLSIVVFVMGTMMDTVLAIGFPDATDPMDPFKQVVEDGGENDEKWASDGVTVSKVIKGTGTEDYFDITLQVKTKHDIQQIISKERIAVVVVADLSNTMKSDIKGNNLCPNSTAYPSGDSYIKSCIHDEVTDEIFAEMKAGKAVAEIQEIVRAFAANSAGITGNQIGVVGFNTDGLKIQDMKDLTSYSVTTFNNNVYRQVISQMRAYEATSDPTVYTNIEAGLTMAKKWLDAAPQKHKYIIFLSDGLPTTYLKDNQACTDSSNCKGRDARDHDGINAQLTDRIRGRRLKHGSNYSDTGATKAREVAMTLKKQGVNIISVGVGLSTFNGTPSSKLSGITYGGSSIVNKLNGEQMIVNQIHRSFLDTVSTVQNNFSGSTFDNALKNKWELLRKFSGLSSTNYYWDNTMEANWYRDSLSKNQATSTDDKLFEKWLQYGIGSGRFYDVSDNAGLTEAMKQIKDELVTILKRISRLWLTSDPMGTVNQSVGLTSYIQFIGFVKSNGSVVQSLNGGADVNTATYGNNSDYPNGYINWDLKTSTYRTEGNVHIYELKYRVRLKTDQEGFIKETAYKTNDKTTLYYALDINNTLTEDRSVDYPIPEVKGYLTDIKVKKTVEGLAPGFTFPGDNGNFTFAVTFKKDNKPLDNREFKYDKYNASGSLIDHNQPIQNNGTFTLRDGEYVIIKEIFHDVEWTVNEIAKDGFVSTLASGVSSGTTQSTVALTSMQYNNKAYYISMNKVDEDDNTIPLEGVRFSLYQNYDSTTGKFSGYVTNMNNYELKDLLTSNEGVINFGNLSFPVGSSATYYLVEEDTIDKYSVLPNYVLINVSAAGISAEYEGETLVSTGTNDTSFVITVPNARGIDLPETGGIGSSMFELLGILLILVSGVVYSVNKKKLN